MLENLQGKFLIATPEMDDDYFDRTVVYICEHNQNGAMGVVINTPTDLSVLELLTRMDFQWQISGNTTKINGIKRWPNESRPRFYYPYQNCNGFLA